ncbi:MAG: phosphodiester glycosidase family protein [Oscillochloris sp.]|nr:phosphodiester glycosidase family protein [Oscillochloris sp.]
MTTPMQVPTLFPTGTPAPPAPTATPGDTGWQPAAPGVELRRMQAQLDGFAAPVQVARIDPATVAFELGYAPDSPLALRAWVAQSGAVASINGGFFDEQGRTVALLVRDGERFGESYVGRGGQFSIDFDGAISLRSLAATPYDPAEPLATALQGWPMLVWPAGVATYDFEDGERARRSALAIDGEGRVLLIACPTAAFTLRELSQWLAGSDLEIAAAMNLDGGSSTGLLVHGDQAESHIEAFVPLPIVFMAIPQ